jgi:hypothetical protein
MLWYIFQLFSLIFRGFLGEFIISVFLKNFFWSIFCLDWQYSEWKTPTFWMKFFKNHNIGTRSTVLSKLVNLWEKRGFSGFFTEPLPVNEGADDSKLKKCEMFLSCFCRYFIFKMWNVVLFLSIFLSILSRFLSIFYFFKCEMSSCFCRYFKFRLATWFT